MRRSGESGQGDELGVSEGRGQSDGPGWCRGAWRRGGSQGQMPDLGRSADLVDEIRHHVLERAELLMAEGWEREEALREAERRFGDAERIRQEMAHADGEPGWGGSAGEVVRSVAADLRYAVRGLRANPTFTAAVVTTLALGIGAAASIFAVVDALLIRPLPYADAERWVEVNQAVANGGWQPGLRTERIMALRDASEGLFDAWVVHQRQVIARVDGPRAEMLYVVAVTPMADVLLGIPLLLGRGFTPEDARPGAPPVAILTRRYWARLGADPAVIGRTLRTESGPVTVVGVLRGGVKFPPTAPSQDLWLPLRDDFTMADRTLGIAQGVWARLPEGTSLTMTQERANALTASLSEQASEGPAWAVRVVPAADHRANPDVRGALWTLSATVLTIFLIALVNGVNLLLVRASARTREIAVRTAIGASRWRLLRQFLAEGIVLGVLGGAAALALAWAAVAVMRGTLPSDVIHGSPHAFEVGGRTLGFSFGASLLVGAALGVLPAAQLLRRRGTPALSGIRSGEEPPARRRVRKGLVVAQVALSMTLLVGAGLFVNGFVRLLRVDPGFEYERVALADLMASPTRYPDGAARAELARELEEALEARPETEGVSVTTGSSYSFDVTLEAEGRPVSDDQPEIVPFSAISADHFETIGLRLLAGRGLDASDAGTQNVVIDRDLARSVWGAADPVGRRFRTGGDDPWMTVVGIVPELRMTGRDQRPGPGQYLRARDPESVGSYIELAMRTSGPPEALLPVFEETLRAVDPEQAYWRLRTGAQALAEEEETPRFLVTLMSLLAAVAVTLAAVGLYGVLAYSVARRDRELGVRMALGAGRARVRAMVLREGMGLAGLGVAFGLLGSLWLARMVEALLYEVEPDDGATLALTAAMLLCVASFAAFLPARRATRVDPVEVLRAE